MTDKQHRIHEVQQRIKMQTFVNTASIRQLLASALAICCLLGGSIKANASETNQQIRLAVENYAIAKLAVDEVKIGHLDKRLRLTSCRSPLTVFLPRGAQRVGNSTFGVQCSDTPGWKIYLPVQLNRFARVAVSKQSLPKGTIIGEADITFQKMDLSQMNYGHFKSIDEVVGMQVKRSIRGGEPLSSVNLSPRRMIKRGDIITILAEVAGLTVRVKGHALSDGFRGEAIRVKNQRSKRILQAEIIAPGIVRVRL